MNIIFKKLFLFYISFLFVLNIVSNEKADLVVFSFNRPLQLYAFLESLREYVTNLNHVEVIYRASNDAYAQAYGHVQRTFSECLFVRQGNNPRKDFKPLVLRAFNTTTCPYILFAVDDIVVKDYIDVGDCIGNMEKNNAYGFYLRLGKNITMRYRPKKQIKVPPLVEVEKDVYTWHMSRIGSYWGYPNSVDMVLYRKRDVIPNVRSMPYSTPNTFESVWSGKAHQVYGRTALCYKESKIVNLPLNRVQEDYNNPHTGSYTSVELLKIFNDGLKMDIKPLFKIYNLSAHMDYEPTFTLRVTVK